MIQIFNSSTSRLVGLRVSQFKLKKSCDSVIKGQKGRLMVEKDKQGVKSNKFEKAIFGGTLSPLIPTSLCVMEFIQIIISA